MGVPRKYHRLVDDKELFEQFYVVGGAGYSFNKLEGWAAEKYGRNPRTGKFVSNATVWFAVNRYHVRNYDNPEVKNIYFKWLIDLGLDPPTEEEYLMEISHKAKGVFAKKQYENWVKKEHPELPYLED